eukprot:gnl/MRDRNA2_/MRDRNA2_83860_c0_seq1.p1 gnl/MRDRNA2_/MRDRNA2_83860_c0~~gnl/MRDRNA2_/MRDRNA2_83860_c0_seq1.p1  ORF type:complete len:100 (-),score=12.83 gnl/MRDRNA2_/MRDRNA2_83860_c0_seq1:145-444(-)
MLEFENEDLHAMAWAEWSIRAGANCSDWGSQAPLSMDGALVLGFGLMCKQWEGMLQGKPDIALGRVARCICTHGLGALASRYCLNSGGSPTHETKKTQR